MDADVRTVEKEVRSDAIESSSPASSASRPRAGEIQPLAGSRSERWARALFIEALRRQGVKVAASLYRPRRLDMLPGRDERLPRIAEYQSEPLADAIKVTLKVSHNLYASTLPILVGLKTGTPSAEGGLRRQAKLLRGFGIDPESVSFAGGAGGAQADSVTPRATVSVLRAMAKHGQRPRAAGPRRGRTSPRRWMSPSAARSKPRRHARLGKDGG